VLAAEVCLDLCLAPLDPHELYRYLGYPAHATPAPRVAERIAQAAAGALPALRPQGTYAVYRVARRTARSICLGQVTISGSVGKYLDHSDRAAVFVVTAGVEISHLAKAATADGDAFTAWVRDAAGSWAAEAAADALMLRIRRHLGEKQELTLRYSPGYCGMTIGNQQKLFRLVDAEAVGVTLMPSLLMHPLKSISGLVGLAPAEFVGRYLSPCDRCPRTGCHMRR
jgi:hypothetical protein